MVAEDGIHQLHINVQLIKNTENFIYCGGDFALPTNLNKHIQEQVTYYSNVIGHELMKLGYRGICGVDCTLCPNGSVKFMEINPRYQGSCSC